MLFAAFNCLFVWQIHRRIYKHGIAHVNKSDLDNGSRRHHGFKCFELLPLGQKQHSFKPFKPSINSKSKVKIMEILNVESISMRFNWNMSSIHYA